MEVELGKEDPVTRTIAKVGKDELGSDSIHLRHIIPEEVWTLVIDKLLKEKPADVQNLSNSSPYFRQLLSPLTTVHHFEEVFQVVASSLWQKNGLEGFSLSEVLNCRGVCSKWNTTIEKLIPEKFQHFGQSQNNNINLAWVRVTFEDLYEENNWFTNSPTWTTNKMVQNFLRHFEPTHFQPSPNQLSKPLRNPLIWDKLSIRIAYDGEHVFEDYLQYLEDISTLLSKYGHHFRKFSLVIDKDNFFDEGLKLQEWFSKMPNLNEIIFESDFSEHNESPLEFHEQDYSFQKLENLRALEIKAIPPHLFDQLIRHNSQITKLILNYWHVEYYFFLEPLPNLRNLEIEFGSPLILDYLWLVQWPLETLTVTLYDNDFDNSDFVDLDDLFRVLEHKFGTTLVSLDLDNIMDDENGEEAIYEACRNGRLNLPSLKKIRLCLSGVVNCLDFLLPMKENLEVIEVYVGYKYPVSEEQKIKETNGRTVEFVGFEDRMLESNVWRIFENLREFQVTACWAGMTYGQKRVFSRKDLTKNKSILAV